MPTLECNGPHRFCVTLGCVPRFFFRFLFFLVFWTPSAAAGRRCLRLCGAHVLEGERGVAVPRAPGRTCAGRYRAMALVVTPCSGSGGPAQCARRPGWARSALPSTPRPLSPRGRHWQGLVNAHATNEHLNTPARRANPGAHTRRRPVLPVGRRGCRAALGHDPQSHTDSLNPEPSPPSPFPTSPRPRAAPTPSNSLDSPPSSQTARPPSRLLLASLPVRLGL